MPELHRAEREQLIELGVLPPDPVDSGLGVNPDVRYSFADPGRW